MRIPTYVDATETKTWTLDDLPSADLEESEIEWALDNIFYYPSDLAEYMATQRAA